MAYCLYSHSFDCFASLTVCTAFAADIPEICGTEPHSDVGGFAVVFGIGHRTESAAACCQACQDHAEKMSTEGKPKPCNSWVFCPEPVCWGLDTGWNHTFGERSTTVFIALQLRECHWTNCNTAVVC